MEGILTAYHTHKVNAEYTWVPWLIWKRPWQVADTLKDHLENNAQPGHKAAKGTGTRETKTDTHRVTGTIATK